MSGEQVLGTSVLSSSSSSSSSEIQEQERTICEYCQHNRRHPLFLYLISDRRVSSLFKLNKHQYYVGLSSQPSENVKCDNRERGFRAGKKVTKSISPYWQLQLVFQIKSHARDHKAAYKTIQQSNRLSFFIQYVCSLSVIQHTSIFVRDPDFFNSFVRQAHTHPRVNAFSSFVSPSKAVECAGGEQIATIDNKTKAKCEYKRVARHTINATSCSSSSSSSSSSYVSTSADASA